MKKVSLIIGVLFIIHPSFSQNDDELLVYSQENEILEPKVTLEFGVGVVSPIGDFKKLYDKEGMGGFSAAVFVPTSKNLPLDLGLNFGLNFMSATEYSYPIFSYEKEVKVKSEITGFILPIHFAARIYPLKHIQSKIQPYFDGLIGGNLFVVTQTTEGFSDEFEPLLFPESHVESTSTGSFSYGYGVGLKTRISKNNLLYLNTKFDQLFGGEVKYLDATQVNLTKEGKYENVYHYSKTDILRFSIGLHLMIE